MKNIFLGNSSAEPTAILSEVDDQRKVMKTLLNLSDDYWKKILEVPNGAPLFGYKLTPEAPTVFSPILPKTGGPVARRTRSKQHNAKTKLFQSPMI